MIPAAGTAKRAAWDKARARMAAIEADLDAKAREAVRRAEVAARRAASRAAAEADVAARYGRGPSGAIIREVAEKHGCTLGDIVGTSRLRPLVRARQEAMWRLREERQLSLPQIAERIGGRDHTTVLHGVRTHAARARGPGA